MAWQVARNHLRTWCDALCWWLCWWCIVGPDFRADNLRLAHFVFRSWLSSWVSCTSRVLVSWVSLKVVHQLETWKVWFFKEHSLFSGMCVAGALKVRHLHSSLQKVFKGMSNLSSRANWHLMRWKLLESTILALASTLNPVGKWGGLGESLALNEVSTSWIHDSCLGKHSHSVWKGEALPLENQYKPGWSCQ